jgi:hypothetical protein
MSDDHRLPKMPDCVVKNNFFSQRRLENNFQRSGANWKGLLAENYYISSFSVNNSNDRPVT